MSNKQPIVTLSTCYIKCLPYNFAKKFTERFSFACVAKKLAILLSNNPAFHDRSKYIGTCYHFRKECIIRKEVQVKYVKS